MQLSADQREMGERWERWERGDGGRGGGEQKKDTEKKRKSSPGLYSHSRPKSTKCEQ